MRRLATRNPMNRRHLLLLVVVAILPLSGCATRAMDVRGSLPGTDVPDTYQNQAEGETSAVELAVWWSSFGDPTLSDLIDRALAANTSITIAKARLHAARAALRAERGTLWPSISAGASHIDPFKVSSGSGGDDFFQAGVDAAWEAELFGGRRHSIEAITADTAAVEADLEDVRRSTSAEVAFNYIDARGLQQRLMVARDNLANQDDTLALARWRVQAGLVSGLDVQQAITLRAQTAASIPVLEQSLDAALNRVAVLVGEVPGAVTGLLDQPSPIPAVPAVIAPGLPASLMQRRPDLIAAEQVLAAEVARVGVARAQLYPTLRLSGALSGNGNTLSEVGDGLVGQLVGSVTAPIFQGGRLRARVAQQQAQVDAAVARYRGTLLLALEEAENALYALDRTAARLTELEIAESAARSSVELAQLRYTSGLSDFQALLSAQRSLLGISDSNVAARVSHVSAAIALFKALGGGWSFNTSEASQ